MTTTILAAATPILTKAFAQIYDAGKEKYHSHLSALNTKRAAESLYKKIASVEKVKTIWQVDKPVNLRKFYYPSKVIFDGKIRGLDRLSELPPRINYLFQGTIGQGKSTFLRYLCIKELEEGNRFPLFVELRRLGSDMSLRDLLLLSLETLGIKTVTADLFEFLATSGKLVFLLDAFDEIQPDKMTAVLNEIEHLIDAYPETQIIVTSRPQSGIQNSAKLHVILLASLTQSDHEGFLKKIMPLVEERRHLLEAINSSSAEIGALITTPLMLTLLVLAYRSDNVIPRKIAEFYEGLFLALISRHDKTKPGYIRHRYASLGDKELQILFEAFCFISRTRSLGNVNTDQLYDIVKTATEFTHLKCNDQVFKNELTKVACLLSEEGQKLYFIHKSVQEYYAAMYVKRSSDAFAQSFYSKVLDMDPNVWDQELSFLKQIDQYRYDKYFFVPGVIGLFKGCGTWDHEKCSELSVPEFKKFCAQMFFGFTEVAGKKNATPYRVQWGNDAISYHVSQFIMQISLKCFSENPTIPIEKFLVLRQEVKAEEFSLSFDALCEHTDIFPVVFEFSKNYIEQLNLELQEKMALIAKEEGKASKLMSFSDMTALI